MFLLLESGSRWWTNGCWALVGLVKRRVEWPAYRAATSGGWRGSGRGSYEGGARVRGRETAGDDPYVPYP
eukprot:scaffold69987_cov10-Prasinocladus_malaysianus.AAC.1